MPSNNLHTVRIADNQTSGQHRTANEALDGIDAALTNEIELFIDVNPTSFYSLIDSYYRYVIVAGDAVLTDSAEVILTSSWSRGLTFWRNELAYKAIVHGEDQTEADIVIPPGGYVLIDYDGINARPVTHQQPFFHTVAVSDESTVLTTGTAKVTFRMPCRVWITEVRASLNVAQSGGSVLTVDINEAGASILSTKLTIDNSEKTSKTAATPAVISDSALADDAEITVDIDTVGTGSPAGLKVTFIGFRY